MKSMKASILSPFKCILSTVLLVGSLSCGQNNKTKIDDQTIDIQHISRELTSIPLDYAENFSLKKGEGFYLLTISNPWFDADQSFSMSSKKPQQTSLQHLRKFLKSQSLSIKLFVLLLLISHYWMR